MNRLILVIAMCLPAAAHTTLFTSAGAAYTRSDYANVVVSYNNEIRAGMPNANGRPMIAAGSDPVAALRAAAYTWSSIDASRIRFAAVAPTLLTNDFRDLLNVIMVRDTAEIRSIVGDAAAITLLVALPTTGEIIDSDILFSPSLADDDLPFSTNGAPNTLDLQAIATHELGHVLGAGHSHLIAATMFPSGGAAFRRTLSSDDLAYAREAAPSPEAASRFGILRGFVFLNNGQPAKGIAVTATDPATGEALGALTNSTGAYSIRSVPRGSYILFAEPLDGPAEPGNFSIQNADLNVEASFYQSKRLVEVAEASQVDATFSLPPRIGTVDMDFVAQGRAGGSGDFLAPGKVEATAGTSLDILISGTGTYTSLLDLEIELIGAGAKIRPGSVRVDSRLAFPDGSGVLRFTVDFPDSLHRSIASIVVRRGSAMSTLAGAIVVNPTSGQILGLTTSSIVNAATAASGPVAPNSWVSIFAKNLAREFVLGPETLPIQIDGTTVFITDIRGVVQLGRLQFVSPEQINFLMPSQVASGPARLTVIGVIGQGSTDIQVAAVAPGIFAANSAGCGPAAATYLRVLPGGEQQSGLTFGTNPGLRENVPMEIAEGAPLYVIFYGTGLRSHSTPVTATMGGLDVPVLAAVAQGQYAGLDQINVGPLPIALAGRGEVNVNFQVDGRMTNPVTVNIR